MHPSLTKTLNADDTVTISGNCVLSGRPASVTVTGFSFRQYMTGNVEAAQAFPEVSPNQRMFITNGIFPKPYVV